MRALATGMARAASGAAAHTTENVGGGLVAGFVYPILGPSHLVAIVAVGLWGALVAFRHLEPAWSRAGTVGVASLCLAVATFWTGERLLGLAAA